jgi:hypothetical protein
MVIVLVNTAEMAPAALCREGGSEREVGFFRHGNKHMLPPVSVATQNITGFANREAVVNPCGEASKTAFCTASIS